MAKHIILNDPVLIEKYLNNKSEMQKILKKELSDEKFMQELFKILKTHETDIKVDSFFKV
jgi:hypothetical protein